jgi:UDP-N-acetylmuramate dehydrogenase
MAVVDNSKTGTVAMLADEPMSRHTSWRVGGPADRFYTPISIAELSELLASLPKDEPICWVGLGSNLLVRDGGVRGTVIATHGFLAGIEQLDEHHVRVESGVPCAKLAKRSAAWGLGSAEFFAGIPGTVGGALAMNAGAFGGETWRHVTSVETIDRQGRRRRREPSEYQIAYRSVRGPDDEWFLSADLYFERGDTGREDIREVLARRKATQPIGLPSCGSVFRNPTGDYAARLIEAAGLKGFCIGGACISEMHANFIINTGDATAADIENLISHIQEKVAETHGVALYPEVRIIGEVSP